MLWSTERKKKWKNGIQYVLRLETFEGVYENVLMLNLKKVVLMLN